MTELFASLEQDLQTVFREVFDDETLILTDDYNASHRTDWDSLASLNLMFSIEQKFGVRFQGSEFNRLPDVAALTRMLRSKLESRGL